MLEFLAIVRMPSGENFFSGCFSIGYDLKTSNLKDDFCILCSYSFCLF